MAQVLSEQELLALVDSLADGDWHSGEELAKGFGISRAALAKRVARLADWQLHVEARQGLGYRLSQAVERLDAQRLQAALPGLRVRVLPVADSTSDQVAGAPAEEDPQVLLAEFQRAGRGRRGRTWVSPFGAQLALSLAWSFDALPPQLTALPLAIGVACARSLRACGLDDVGLKWPNDIYVGSAKLGGILLEHRGEAGGGCRVVVGIGINLCVSPQYTEAVTQAWTNLNDALAARGRPPASRNALAIDLLRQLRDVLSAYPAGGFDALRAEWDAVDLTRGRRLRVVQADGAFDAVGCGADRDGALLVESSSGQRAVYAGDISLRLS